MGLQTCFLARDHGGVLLFSGSVLWDVSIAGRETDR
jgi:hypothetical protein